MAAVTVEVFFNLSATGGTFLTLDDATKGQLGSATYVLAGDLATAVTADARAVTIRRGRNRQTDVIDAGTCGITLNNIDRDFDPTYTSSPYYGNILPGKRVRVSRGGVSIFDGYVEDWNFDYELGGLAFAAIDAADGLAQLGRREFDAWTTSAQKTGARILAVLDRNEVAFTANKSIDTGNADLQADNVSWGSNALNYLQLVNTAEQGYLFVDRAGVLQFIARTSVLNQFGAVTFSSSAVPFETIEIQYGSEFLYNWVAVDRVGGTQQSAQDSTSQTAYGVRRLTLGNQLYSTDVQSADTANYLLNKYKQPELRVTGVSVAVHSLGDATAAEVLSLDITDVVNVVFQPPGGGSAISKTVIIEGVTHEIGPKSHVVTFDLGAVDNRLFLVLDSTQYGVLDTNLLAF